MKKSGITLIETLLVMVFLTGVVLGIYQIYYITYQKKLEMYTVQQVMETIEQIYLLFETDYENTSQQLAKFFGQRCQIEDDKVVICCPIIIKARTVTSYDIYCFFHSEVNRHEKCYSIKMEIKNKENQLLFSENDPLLTRKVWILCDSI